MHLRHLNTKSYFGVVSTVKLTDYLNLMRLGLLSAVIFKLVQYISVHKEIQISEVVS